MKLRTAVFLTAEEVSARLKIAVSTLDTWRCEKRGPAYHKLGRKVVYAEQDVDSWVEGSRVDPNEERQMGIPVLVERSPRNKAHRFGGYQRKQDKGRTLGEKTS